MPAELIDACRCTADSIINVIAQAAAEPARALVITYSMSCHDRSQLFRSHTVLAHH